MIDSKRLCELMNAYGLAHRIDMSISSSKEDLVKQEAQRLIELAATAGLVLTIERRSIQPLAMGHAEYVVETRPVRVPS